MDHEQHYTHNIPQGRYTQHTQYTYHPQMYHPIMPKPLNRSLLHRTNPRGRNMDDIEWMIETGSSIATKSASTCVKASFTLAYDVKYSCMCDDM